MAILIKGMEMPESCASCDIACGFYLDLGVDGLLSKTCRTESRRPDCPLFPFPQHGRLIDADALLESIEEARKNQPEIEDVYTEDYFMVAEWLASAPTIIPAEEGE